MSIFPKAFGTLAGSQGCEVRDIIKTKNSSSFKKRQDYKNARG